MSEKRRDSKGRLLKTNMWTRQERQGMPIHGNLCRQTSYLKARGTGNP